MLHARGSKLQTVAVHFSCCPGLPQASRTPLSPSPHRSLPLTGTSCKGYYGEFIFGSHSFFPMPGFGARWRHSFLTRTRQVPVVSQRALFVPELRTSPTEVGYEAWAKRKGPLSNAKIVLFL